MAKLFSSGMRSSTPNLNFAILIASSETYIVSISAQNADITANLKAAGCQRNRLFTYK